MIDMTFGERRFAAWALALALTLRAAPALAAPGGLTTNGASTDPAIVPGFLFEPEFPLQSMKSVPIWNELEQLLDNPYAVQTCATLPAAVPALIRNTPGTTVLPGSPPAVVYPAYCTRVAPSTPNGTDVVVRRPSFGVTLPPLLVHPLNYNPTTGEEMRLLNPAFPGASWLVPGALEQDPGDPNRWIWSYERVSVSAGAGRVPRDEAEIDYNAPVKPDFTVPRSGVPTLADLVCITTTEAVPPEGSVLCGGDPGEPGYAGFGVWSSAGYSTPAVPGGTVSGTSPAQASDVTGLTLRDPAGCLARALESPGSCIGTGTIVRLRKPTVRATPVAQPNFVQNVDPANVRPSSENDYMRGNTFTLRQASRLEAMRLGKAFFWDMQVGSDAVQSCGSCHAHAGADNRTKNQINPNHFAASPDTHFEVRQPNEELVASDFPFQKLRDPAVAGDPKCDPAITASVDPGVLEHAPEGVSGRVVCDAANVIPDKNNAGGTKVANDVASSMGVHFGLFYDVPAIGAMGAGSAVGGVRSVLPDLRSPNAADSVDPIAGFAGAGGHDLRRVEPRNTPTVFGAALNFDNFWDGRARHDFQGGSVFGAADPQRHVFVGAATGSLTPTRQIIRFASLASLATGPGLSEFEMSLLGRNWAKIGKKLLQAGVTPLANQLVDPTDSFLGVYSNQAADRGACNALAVGDRSASWSATGIPGKPGLCVSYPGLIRRAFDPPLWQNATSHLDGCYTSNAPQLAAGLHLVDAALPPAQRHVVACPAGTPDDPFDHYVLAPVSGAASAADTNQFTQMEGNFSLFWGLSVHLWATVLLPDDTPFDQFLDQNPDMFESIGEAGEPGLVADLPVCTSATQRHCFREVGAFRRDAALGGTRQAGEPDPLLGMDLFQGSNLSRKNPNFRAARCGECHAGGTFTDNTVPFTVKAQLGDFIGEFSTPGTESLIEPLGRTRNISGFLLESELGENGQDAVERRIANQSIVPNPVDGLAYPDGLFNPFPAADGLFTGPNAPNPNNAPGYPRYVNAGQSFFDNGVYNLGVTRCEADETGVTGVCDDLGRGGTDAWGWPLSLAALMLKDLGGADGQPCPDAATCPTEPGVALATFDPELGGGGGLFEETAQDQQLNPGEEGTPVTSLLPAHLGPWANQINVGDAMPELDEVFGGLNTLTDTAVLEGFIDTLGPFNPAGTLNESYNAGEGPFMGTWPIVNRVGRFGSVKAAPLREVELTGPYFHNGGKLTLRQVVDFYSRGGDFPVTNAAHRDFNVVNLDLEVQSNLSEEEKVALVDFLLQLTDERVRHERAPFDHPQVILPLDGAAPENDFRATAQAGRDAMLAGCVDASRFGPGQRACAAGMYLDVPATGAAGTAAPLPAFLNVRSDDRASPHCDPAAGPISHYCH